ncbi:hypothetical protein [Anaerotignum propionicum]|jgi:hypothetical protein|uniref:hypothetical protein n=1 Tax=Anaerotignum propionicum TaxID=28446 RepID=UPI0028A20302|nr:hypothetical protein [Anaerotignum propionicum]
MDIKKNEISAFIMILEKYLNIINENELENQKSNMQFDVRFAHEIPDKDQAYSKMYDRCANIANNVIKYLIFYKRKAPVISPEVKDLALHNAFFHLTNIDKKEVLDSLTVEWQVGGRDITKDASGNLRSEIFNNCLIRDEFIALDRIEHRRNTIINDMVFTQKQQEEEEFVKEYLKEVLYGYSDDYSCLISGYRIRLGHLIRTYKVLKELSTKFINSREDINSNNLNDICLVISEKELTVELFNNKIPKENINTLVSILTYSKRGDLFDTPLIKNGSDFIIIPSIVTNTDISQVILSIVEQFNFEGKLFENAVLELLKNNNILAHKENYKDETGEYQCDIMFLIGKDLLYVNANLGGNHEQFGDFIINYANVMMRKNS